jgi:ribonuclease P protein component
MFPRSLRVHRTTEILRILRQGTRWRFGFLTLHGIQGGSAVRATVIIDKKVSKRAVVRNKIKRQLREQLQHAQLPAGAYVLRGYSGCEQSSLSELRQVVQQVLKKVS